MLLIESSELCAFSEALAVVDVAEKVDDGTPRRCRRGGDDAILNRRSRELVYWRGSFLSNSESKNSSLDF